LNNNFESSFLKKKKKIKVEVALFYRFDGWLINIETHLKDQDHADSMINFVAQLTRKMHEKDPESLVIWFEFFFFLKKNLLF